MAAISEMGTPAILSLGRRSSGLILRPESTSTLQIATEYIDRGWSPIPIKHRAKGPVLNSWPALRLTRETVADYFNGQPMNVGVILGPASQGLTDVDLDCELAVTLAPQVLRPTSAIFGRPSRPASHWL
jgi:hypothetical protein